MKTIFYEIKEICRHNRDGSFETQHKRLNNLKQFANQLLENGYRLRTVHSLKPKHVIFIIQLWRKQKLSISTMKQRMAHIRWLTVKIRKQNIIAKDNAFYGIDKRQYVTNISKAFSLNAEQLIKIEDPFIKISLQLQQAFGLRSEEAIKFIPSDADKDDHIALKASWTKGGKARDIPITNQAQRDVLNQAKSIAGKGSLIPSHLKYYQQKNVYSKQTAKAGLKKCHGLRHHYAQYRYQQLTSWLSPVQGGPSRKNLAAEQRDIDQNARLMISQELGHERIQIVANYLGR